MILQVLMILLFVAIIVQSYKCKKLNKRVSTLEALVVNNSEHYNNQTLNIIEVLRVDDNRINRLHSRLLDVEDGCDSSIVVASHRVH